MRSISDPDPPTTADRILRAAVARFATDGFARATIRAIAADAGVSPGLVPHHFGSKDGLREACDQHVIDFAESQIAQIGRMERGDERKTFGSLSYVYDQVPTMFGYMANALIEGGPRVDALVDRMVDISERFYADAERAGWCAPSQDRRARAVLSVIWDLGWMVLTSHMNRALGMDSRSPEGMRRVSRAALEIFTHGVFTDSSWLDAFDAELRETRRNDT